MKDPLGPRTAGLPRSSAREGLSAHRALVLGAGALPRAVCEAAPREALPVREVRLARDALRLLEAEPVALLAVDLAGSPDEARRLFEGLRALSLRGPPPALLAQEPEGPLWGALEEVLPLRCRAPWPPAASSLRPLLRELLAPSAEPLVLREAGFELRELLGVGGFGVVYRARRAGDGGDVALKLLRRGGDARAFRRGLQSELRCASRVLHPALLRVLEAVALEGHGEALVLEALDGESLEARLLREGALPVVEALELASALASALEALHRAQVAHRDLKPSNVLLHREGGAVVPKLLDFGAAALLDRLGATELEGEVLGSPAYLAPERLRGEASDGRVDVYALGCLLFQMLAGRPPFCAPSVEALVYLQLYAEAPLVRSPEGALPAPLAPLVRSMLAKDPEERPASAAVARSLAALCLRAPRAPRRVASGLRLRAVQDAAVEATTLSLRGATGTAGAAASTRRRPW